MIVDAETGTIVSPNDLYLVDLPDEDQSDLEVIQFSRENGHKIDPLKYIRMEEALSVLYTDLENAGECLLSDERRLEVIMEAMKP